MSTRIVRADSYVALALMAEASVDAIVCDPPYMLGFMGKAFDNPHDNPADDPEFWRLALRVLKPGGHLLAFSGTRTYHRMASAVEAAGFEVRDMLHWTYGSGFPKSLDVGKAIDKARDDRADVLRVTAFVAAARDAAGVTNAAIDESFGFAGMAGHWTTRKSQPAVPTWDQWQRLRDLLGFGDEMDAEVWRLNGRKGQPGENWERREVVGVSEYSANRGTANGSATFIGQDEPERVITAPATPEAARWNGWGTALKPSHEPIVVARKPFSGTVAANVLAWGTGAINVNGCRVPTGASDAAAMERCNTPGSGQLRGRDPAQTARGNNGSDSAARPLDTTAGRWPPNTLLSHAPGCRLVGTRRVKTGTAVDRNKTGTRNSYSGGWGAAGPDQTHADADGLETVAAYDCAPGCPVAEMGRQSGVRGTGTRVIGGPPRSQTDHINQLSGRPRSDAVMNIGDTGTAARFFPNFDADPGFLYQAKASRAERNAGTERNAHPTVKPIAVMRWLCRLVTPPGGLVLDPFAGSGSTVIAAHLEGFNAIGIEREAEYAEIARARVRWWVEDADEKARAKTVPNAGGKLGLWNNPGGSQDWPDAIYGARDAKRTNGHGEPPPVEQMPLL